MRPSDPWLRKQLAPARRQLLGVVASGVVGCALVLGQAWAVAGLVLAVLRGQELTQAALFLVAVMTLRGVVGWLGDRAAAGAAAVVGTSLRRQLVRTVVERDLDVPTGSVAVLATRGVSAAEPYLTRYLPALVLACVLPPAAVLVIATQDLLSAAVVLCTLPLIPVFGALVGLATRDRAQEQWREMSSLSGHFLDVVRGLPTLVAHRRARAQSRRIAAITDRYRVASLRTLRIAFASSLVLELVATLSVALVAVIIGVRLADGSLALHTALVVLLLAPEAYWPLRRVGAEFHAAAEGVATFEAVREAIDPAVTPAGAPAGSAAPSGVPLVLRGVSVTHPGRSQPAVSRLDALIPAQGITVVSGPSGCGKSTLLDALASLLPLSAGTITADDRPVGGPQWRAQVAWLPQRPHFVSGTLADNLRLGSPSAGEDRLWAALRQVALEERVRALPRGIQTVLGEDGTTLSAGERARLALARVVVADRPWLLLDEPTAHLDELTERVITDTLVELGRRSAVVVVAHRSALVDVADHRIVLPPPPAAAPPGPAAARSTRATRRRPTVEPVPDEAVDLPRPRFGVPTMLGALASASGVALTATAGWLIVQASTHPPVLTMLVAIVGVRAFGLSRPVLRYAERLRSHDAALQLLARRRVQVYDAVVPLTPGRLGRRRGDLLSSVVDDVDSVVDRQLRVRMPQHGFVIVATLACAVTLLLHPPAAPVVALGSLVAGAGAHLVARRGAARAERAAVAARADLSTRVVEAVQVARELRMWQATEQTVGEIGATSDGLGRAMRAVAAWTATGRAWALSVAGVTMTVVALVAAPAVSAGTLSGPVMALLVLVPLALADVALPLAEAGALSVRTDAATERLARLERAAPAVRDTVSRPPSLTHDLCVDGVRGQWDRHDTPTAECTLHLEPGDRIAVVGASGSGKSTLAALLLRFLDPVSGRVTHGGVDLRDLALDDVRRHTGLVDDDPHVFATSLAENIRLARPGATDTEIDDALRQARLGPWVDALPDGLDTWLGDGHAGVSGGERARLGVARALLADQSVLVLGEPAAHLDHATATRLAQELLSGPRTRSVVWVTHSDVGLDLVDEVVDLGQVPSR
ncbi:MAG: thiol reductant ABC exporter subunit CydD [Nocardioides sp.]